MATQQFGVAAGSQWDNVAWDPGKNASGGGGYRVYDDGPEREAAFRKNYKPRNLLEQYRMSQTDGVDAGPPPTYDIHELLAAFEGAPQLRNWGGRAIDDAITQTRTSAAQAGNNAAASYGSRMRQMGMNPLAGDAVRAQVKRAGEAPIKDLAMQKEQMQYQARKDAASMAANIASQIGGLRDSYSKTLADYNLRNAAQQEQKRQFAYSTQQQDAQFQQQYELSQEELAAKIAAQGGGSGVRAGSTVSGGTSGDFYPGYIGSPGSPIIPGRINGRSYPGMVFQGNTYDRFIGT